MSLRMIVFWTASVAVLGAAVFDIVRYGVNKLNVMVLIALLAINIFAKLRFRIHARELLLVLLLLPVVIVRSLGSIGISYSPNLEAALVVVVLVVSFVHCTDAVRSLLEGDA